MRHDDYRCSRCGEIAFDARLGKLPVYYEVVVTERTLNARAIQQLAGLTAMLGGGPQAQGVAQALTPDDSYTIERRMVSYRVCVECAAEATIAACLGGAAQPSACTCGMDFEGEHLPGCPEAPS